MYKPTTSQVITYFLTYLPIYESFFFQNINQLHITPVEVHPQLSINGHPVDGELVGC